MYAHGAEGIEALLPSWSLDDLGASPYVDGGPTVACFDAYLAKFGEMVDDIRGLLPAEQSAGGRDDEDEDAGGGRAALGGGSGRFSGAVNRVTYDARHG